MSSRLALLVAAAFFAAALGLTAAARAQTAAASKPAGATAPMHPHQLTVRSGPRPASVPRSRHTARGHRHRNYVHDTFRTPTPIQGTVVGPRM